MIHRSMRFLRTLFALLLVVGAVPAAAQNARERAAIDFALQRGRLLYAIDRAAWVATDDMMAQMPDWRSAGLRGYIVERDGTGYSVSFYGGPEPAPVAFYRGRVENHRIVSREVFGAAARPALTPFQRRLVAARDLVARSTRNRACGRAPFNSAVIPPETPDGPIDVYLLTPQATDREFPFGGHFRATVTAEGRVTGERAFTNSCLTMPAPPPGAFLGVSHMLDPVPTEIHVFTSLAARAPVFVAIVRPERVYEVSGEGVRRVRMGGGRR